MPDAVGQSSPGQKRSLVRRTRPECLEYAQYYAQPVVAGCPNPFDRSSKRTLLLENSPPRRSSLRSWLPSPYPFVRANLLRGEAPRLPCRLQLPAAGTSLSHCSPLFSSKIARRDLDGPLDHALV